MAMPAAAPLFPEYVWWIWFSLTALSAAYVAWDLFTHTPEMKVMKWGWILVTLYTGPVGLLVYWFSCREPAPGTHEAFIAPLWKQTVGSTIHCLAGDATGIIAAAIITSQLRLPMGLDIWVEYAAGFLFGLLIFQALFMKDMLGVGYIQAVKQSFLPEWLSMNAVMAGMIPTMVLLMTREMGAMEPSSPSFWGIMSLATLVGAVTAYPINWWLVKNKLKHGMGTERALGKGGAAREAAPAPPAATMTMAAITGGIHGQPPMAAPAGMEHAGHDMGAMAMPGPGMDHGAPDAMGQGNMAGMNHGGMAGMDMSPGPPVSALRKAIVALLTLLMLAAGYWVASRYGELSMRAGEPMAPMPGMNMAGQRM